MTLTIGLEGYVSSFLLVFARLWGFLLVAPVSGSLLITQPVRVALAALLAFALLPAAAPHLVNPPWGLLPLGIGLQFALGVMLGLVLAVFWSAFAMAGQLVTYQLGIGLVTPARPSLLAAGSVLGEFQSLLALLVFVASGGLELGVVALARSFQALPLTAAGIPAHAVGFLEGLMTTALAMSLLLGAPMLLAGLVVDLSTGILARAFPQLNAYFLALPVGVGVVLAVWMATLPLFFTVSGNVWHLAWTAVSRLLAIWQGR
ncbi:Flagellar biosynthesis protein FliR [Candidatus Hydrogenisulfobacillus filiaventi]|uniref:Flagellar biosynthesis protein FliR n=1 Tax=Candidatus Hydrogenisulfobacillus filiaventi TaxID=2707344 RepID=A0A6F8ZEA8_9FIRM|nr:Flagellar biosynthesis protein FliR [Candidatus Hydrogenisulfobacillus filiaventi]